MKNTLEDLNNHLFEQLERLNDDSLTADDLDKELRRADGMTKIATQIIRNGELAYQTMQYRSEYGPYAGNTPSMLEVKNNAS